FGFAGVHRGEAVTTEDGEAGRTHPRGRRAFDSRPAANIEVKPIADHQAAAARRLDIAPIPVAVLFRYRDKRQMIRPVPVKTIAAKGDTKLVRLGPVAWLAAPDREQADHETFVGHAIEIVELALRLQIVAGRIKFIRANPRQWFAGFPACPGEHVGILPI